jgi:[protein]-arginine 3-hydroxylase / protease
MQETPLHLDSYDNFLCQVAGSKYVRLYAPSQTKFLYVSRDDKHGGMRSSQGNVSEVCVEAPDLAKHSMFHSAAFSHAIMRPGDLLFIPARYWHYLRSTSTSISVNFWF